MQKHATITIVLVGLFATALTPSTTARAAETVNLITNGGFEDGLIGWTRYTTTVSVQSTGGLRLEIIAPSSHNDPAGRMWIDDVALYETQMPAVVSVSNDVGFNDEPAMAVAANGSVYVAYNSFREGNDSLQVTRLWSQGKSFVPQGAWQVLGGKGTYVAGIRTVAAGEKVVVVYAAEKDKNWDVYAVACGPDGPQTPVAVTSDPGVDVKPSAAWHGDTLHVAWESNRNGSRQIYAASMRDGKVSEPQPVSRPDASCYNPSLGVLQSGEVCVAWHSFRKHNYDVYLRRRSSDGAWGTAARLTVAASIDRHPVLFTRGDELWLVYEHAQTERYNIGRTNRRQLIVAKVTPQGLMAPKTGTGPATLTGRCEGAAPAFDSSGRLWLAMLRPRLPRSGWDTFVTCFAGGRWQQASPVSLLKGMDRTPSLAVYDGRVLVAMQGDNAPNSWTDLDQMAAATSNIYLAAIDAAAMPMDTGLELERLVESAEPFEPAQLRVLRGEDTPTPAIDYKGKRLKLYFGDLHEHSEVSVCNRLGDQSVDESYQHMRDIARHDFACVTDHGYNINPYVWGHLAKTARTNDDPDRFLTFLGEEWTSTFEEYSEEHPYGFYGHRNLIFADAYFPKWFNARDRRTPAELWEELRKLNANFVQIPHQLADTGNVPSGSAIATARRPRRSSSTYASTAI
ncbi:MAG: DUF3604 domain-containing protein [Candidatus Nealsonbacteria bacterium]|nr:DUF3604 domain-containing protein [Candidatus Nealsonbacteria bacterium]